jgi:predicted alpha/beta superfamily hydrolase
MENVETHRGFRSRFLEAERAVHVWTPPGYSQDARSRYPVLYLHDGQNIFDPETAFVRNQHWQAGETATALVKEGQIAPLIIVAIDITPGKRASTNTRPPTARGSAAAATPNATRK